MARSLEENDLISHSLKLCLEAVSSASAEGDRQGSRCQ
jgi:hypothetical protein